MLWYGHQRPILPVVDFGYGYQVIHLSLFADLWFVWAGLQCVHVSFSFGFVEIGLNSVLSLMIKSGNPSHPSFMQVCCLSVYGTWLADYSAFFSLSPCLRLLCFCFNSMSCVFGSSHHVCRFLKLD